MPNRCHIIIAFIASVLTAGAADVKPIRALLITGGCCHDYARQKEILKKGLEERIHIQVDQMHTEIPEGTSATKPPLPLYGKADYAKGYDIVIHDECAADISDPEIIKGVLAPHRAGTPGVNLHCAMHSYRVGNAGEPAAPDTDRSLWFEYLGLQSSSHGPQVPISIRMTDEKHPITSALQGWTTGNEELYNNVKIFEGAIPLARGKQTIVKANATNEVETVVAWVNNYNGTRVFSTTIGHNNATVEDDRYLDLVARGILWACDKMEKGGQIKAGYNLAK